MTPQTPEQIAGNRPECIIVNCRNAAPASEPFCSKHKDKKMTEAIHPALVRPPLYRKGLRVRMNHVPETKQKPHKFLHDRWSRCPSTHCERSQECRSPNECSAGQTKDWAGVNWRDYLTAEEIERLAQIDRAKKDGQAEQRRIYDRCRKRMGPKNK